MRRAPWTGWVRRCARLAVAASIGVASAQSTSTFVVPYTVQVAALSDPEVAIDLSGSLLRERFPSYVVRAEGTAGAVYRVRVGAFGDRATADAYATALTPIVGAPAAPALAEAIPAGLIDWAPVQLYVHDVGSESVADVIAWGTTQALRIEARDGLVEFRPLDGSEPFVAFDAWKTGDTTDDVVRLDLDGTSTAGDDPAVRDALFRQRLRLLAERLGRDPDSLDTDVVRGAVGERHVVVWRKRSREVESLVSVLRADADPRARDPGSWSGAAPPPIAPAIVRLGDSFDPAPAIAGDGWIVVADGAWTSFVVDDRTWRAIVGTPLAATGSLLIVGTDEATTLYLVVAR